MRFSVATLDRTSKRFQMALIEKSLTLRMTTSRNVWTQILFNKNFSATKAHINAHGFIDAMPVTPNAICEKLKEKSRQIDEACAIELFVSAIELDCDKLSRALSGLIRFIKTTKNTCLWDMPTDPLNLAILEANCSGYWPASKLKQILDDSRERDWIRASSLLVSATVNSLSGVDVNRTHEIFISSCIAQWESHDQTFLNYLNKNSTNLSENIVQNILSEFDTSAILDWGHVEFDQVSDLVSDSVETELFKFDESWCHSNCELSNAVVNHVSSRIRQTLIFLFDVANDERHHFFPMDHDQQVAEIASATEHSFRIFLKLPRIKHE